MLSNSVCQTSQWLCFDACPVNACLPHAAQRIHKLTPDAKLVFMVRDPAAAVFSGEIMLTNMGVPLQWSLTEPLDDPDKDTRFQASQPPSVADQLSYLY